jgi:hypothetical protein
MLSRNLTYSPLILWTNAKAITSYFKLYGKVYISWDNVRMKYEATQFVSGKGKKAARFDDLPNGNMDAAVDKNQEENPTADTTPCESPDALSS